MTRRKPGLVAALVLAILVAILVLSRPQADPYLRSPLDPRGTGPGGLHALVQLAERAGATVRLDGDPGPGDDVVLQVTNRLSGSPERQLRRWVEQGGTLVDTDPDDGVAVHAGTFDARATQRAGPRCDITALRGLRLGTALLQSFTVGAERSACFTDGRHAALVVDRLGRGRVVALTSPAPLVNQAIGQDDDAYVALALLDARPGTHIRVLDPFRFQSGDQVGDGSVLGAMPGRVRQALYLLVIAFLLWGFSRARRLGRPVVEELPAPVPGSDLVLAVGEMMARDEQAAGAAERLRSATRRRLAVDLGLEARTAPAIVLAALDPLVTLDRVALQRALYDPVRSTRDLLDVAHLLDRLEGELHATAIS